MKFKLVLIKLLLLELFIGGSGQVFLIFNVPLRQIFFVLLMFVFVFDLKGNIKPSKISIIIFGIIFWVFMSAFIGVLNHHDNSIIINDISPMLYFFLYFPLKAYFRKYNLSYNYIYKLLVFSSLIVSVFCIIIYKILWINYGGNTFKFYTDMMDTYGREIVSLRRDGFVFYSGLFYVCVTLTLIFFKGLSNIKLSFYEKIVYLLGLIAVFLSMTKGYMLSLIFSHTIILLNKKRDRASVFKVLLFVIPLFVIVSSNFDFKRFKPSEIFIDEGVILRLKTYQESIFKYNESVFIGNGFGTELLSKRFHQENSFLDILVEQGFIGLSFYIFILLVVFKKRRINYGLHVTLIMAYLLSLTNPYINNPLGVGLIILILIIYEREKNGGYA